MGDSCRYLAKGGDVDSLWRCIHRFESENSTTFTTMYMGLEVILKVAYRSYLGRLSVKMLWKLVCLNFHRGPIPGR